MKKLLEKSKSRRDWKMIKYVATLKIKGNELNRTVKAEAYKRDYMSDYDLEEKVEKSKN
ncbi:hypothetical protein AB6N29_03555 [Fusobacterium animalis]|uniref:hypothetical protein n=1 Tax=Fusobacterium animalis TaxID=76859 RepID=UPI0034E04812